MSAHAIARPSAVVLIVGVFGCASDPIAVKRVNPGCSTKGPETGGFSRSDAQATLSEAARVARDCSLATGTARGTAYVRFTPSGCVGDVKLKLDDELPPRDIECVADAFLAVRVPPFAGKPVTVSKAIQTKK